MANVKDQPEMAAANAPIRIVWPWCPAWGLATHQPFNVVAATIPAAHLRAGQNLIGRLLASGASFHEARPQLQQWIDGLPPAPQGPASSADPSAPA